MPANTDITGRVFSRLTAIEISHKRRTPSGRLFEYWLCSCSCGNPHIVNKRDLMLTKVKSCGCLVTGWRNAVVEHPVDIAATPEFQTWLRMRKIAARARWRNSFAAFLADMR